ncbi:MAG: hypothetical protein ACLRUZ_09235 [Faecalimonas sp.]
MAGYIIGLVICSKIALVPATILLVRLPEFAFGMIFVKLNWRADWKISILALILIIANMIFKPEIPASIQTTYIGISSFLVLVFVSARQENKGIQKNSVMKESLKIFLCPVFLVHHIIIINVMDAVDLTVPARCKVIFYL